MEPLGNSKKTSFSKEGGQMNPWIYCLAAGLFFFYEFIQMNMFNALAPDLLKFFRFDARQLGSLSACYFYGTLFSLLFVGLLLDHINTKKIILISMSVSILGTFLFSISSSFTFALMSRFISGLGGAFAFQCALRIAADHFPSSKLALLNGSIVTFGMLGGIAAQTPMTLLADSFNWHQVLWIYTSMGVAFLVIIAISLPKNKLNNLGSLKNTGDSFLALINKVKEKIELAACNRQTWLAGFYTCLFNLPIPLLATWGSLYLTQIHHVSRIEAANIISMLFVGIIIGCPLAGWWSDSVKKRRIPMAISGMLALLVILIIINKSGMTGNNLMMLFFFLGLFSSAQIIGYSVVAESNPHSRSTALGIASLLIMGGGAIAQPIFGWLVDHHSQGAAINKTGVLLPENANFAMLMLPISFFIALIGIIFLKETFPSQKR